MLLTRCTQGIRQKFAAMVNDAEAISARSSDARRFFKFRRSCRKSECIEETQRQPCAQ
jgi:hypothetical protein